MSISELSGFQFDARLDLTNTDLDGIENELANKLKQLYNDIGKETDPQASALLLHKLGRVYHKRSPDMFSLIRSAVLYNAALVRNPINKEIIADDLKQLCLHILALSGANNSCSVDLIEHADVVKQQFVKMRDSVKQTLLEIKTIPDTTNRIVLHSMEEEKILLMQELQIQITKNFKNIMAELACFCENVMGKAPYGFALTGMGSLARNEITPYSDFENIILLERDSDETESYQTNLNYFRWFSVIFQVVLINLQETVVPSVAIVSLEDWFFDDITPNGISFDGMMPHASKFPLGRQQPTQLKPWTTELIKPVDKMLNYLTTEENLKNGYHLSDILTKTCFVYKDANIYDEFEKGVIEIIENDENRASVESDVKNQVVDDLQSFATKFSLSAILKPNQTFNVKHVIYRSTTLFISALGRLCNIQASSCFDIITELHVKNEISDYARHKLRFAVAVACEIRLRWYMQSKKQRDNIDSVHILLKLVGKKSIMSYFQIAYALQCDISKRLKLKQGNFYSSPTLLNLSLAQCFEDQHLINKILSLKKQKIEKQWLYDFDQCLQILENQTIQNETNDENSKQKPTCSSKHKLWFEFYQMGDLLFISSCMEDAIDFLKKALELIKRDILSQKNNNPKNLSEITLLQIGKARIYDRIGYIQHLIGELDEGEKNIIIALGILQNLPPEVNTKTEIPSVLNHYGACLLAQNKIDESIKVLDKALSTNELQETESEILLTLGRCLVRKNKFDEAKQYLDRSLQIKQQISSDVDSDRQVSITLHALGHCLMKMNKLDEAKQYLDRSLQIAERISSDVDSDRGVSITLDELGCCLMEMNKLDEAKQYLDRSLQISERISSDVDSDCDVSITFHELGRCLMKMNKLDEAKQYLDRSLQIGKRISSDVDSDREVSVTLDELGHCLMEMNKLDEAKQYLDKSLQIKQRISSDVDSDREVSITFHELGCCLMKMNKLDEAKQYLDRSLQIAERISSDVDSDRDVSIVLHELGRCLMKMNKLDEAKQCLDRSLQINQRISSDVDSDRDVSITLRQLGRCLMKMSKLDEAKQYLDKSLQIKQQISSDVDSDRQVSITLHALGHCLMKMNKFDEAKQYLDRSLQIKQRISSDVGSDRQVSITLDELGRCLMEMNKLDEAKQYLDRSLQIKQRISSDVDSDRDVSNTFHELGRCLMEMNKLDKAKQYLDRSLQIAERISSDVDSDRDVSIVLHELGRCLMKMNKLDEAKQYLDRSLQIKQRISSDVDSDRDVSITLRQLGRCLMKMSKLDEAKQYLDKSLQIKQQISSDVDSDRQVSITLHALGHCLMKMNKFDEAKQYLDRSLQIKQRISSDVGSDREVSITLDELGRCLMEMNKLDEAKQYLDRSLQIKQRISSDVDSDRDVSNTLDELGRCLMEMNKLDEAKQYLDRSLQIAERISSDVDSDRDVSITLHVFDRCLMKMNKLDEAN